jgi:hypothetical protein
MCTSQDTDQIAAELTQAEGETLRFGIDSYLFYLE